VSMRVLVLSDTHVRPGGRRELPRAVLAAGEQADLIVHAGDLVSASVLDALCELAPTHAVLGNNDHELVGRLPMVTDLEVGGLTVAVVHDSGPTAGRAGRLARMFPGAGLVVFGHSHQPCSEPGVHGQWMLNPGSSTERRRAPTHTFAWVEIDSDAGDGRFRAELVHLDP